MRRKELRSIRSHFCKVITCWMSRVLLQREIESKANGSTIRTQRVRALKYGTLNRITASRVWILRWKICNVGGRHFFLDKDMRAALKATLFNDVGLRAEQIPSSTKILDIDTLDAPRLSFLPICCLLLVADFSTLKIENAELWVLIFR